MLHSLRDGTRVRIRPIEPGDKSRLQHALGRLSRESIRRRFLAAKPTLSAAELRYLTEVDGVDHLALVAVLADDRDQVAGVARCVRLEPGGEDAEFAIVVGDPFQGAGLGTLLATQLADAACRAGIRRFTATALADNEAVRRLMETFAESLEHEALAGGVREVVAVLPGCGAEAAAARLAA
jgi:RimJ/RimL family protein N-acetyltransferase